jgi:hypothetical protein
MRLFVAALVLAAATVPTFAHHPFTPFYDASKPVSLTGVVVELRNINPHIALIVDGTLPDGRSGRWAFEGSLRTSSPGWVQRTTSRGSRQVRA